MSRKFRGMLNFQTHKLIKFNGKGLFSNHLLFSILSSLVKKAKLMKNPERYPTNKLCYKIIFVYSNYLNYKVS